MFEKVVAAPADPILGLTEAFRADSRSHKINLGVGIYKDETGATPILHCVKKAEQKLLTDEKTKNYLGIEGNIEYGRIVQQLLFGQDSALVASGRAKTAQAPGGTGALRIAAEFVVRNGLAKTIWISDPTWANHVSVFQAAVDDLIIEGDAVRAVAHELGGHAVRFNNQHGGGESFAQPSAALMAIHRRLKQTFDPQGIFNPGRLYKGL